MHHRAHQSTLPALPLFQPIGTPIADLARSVVAILSAHRRDATGICPDLAQALAPVVADSDWLPDELRRPAPAGYRREMLYEAEDGSFSIGCFVWGVGQRTPIHDHHSWGVIGVAHGVIESVSYSAPSAGILVSGAAAALPAGACAWVHPHTGDIHRIGCHGDETAISIHVYGVPFDRVNRNRYQPDGTLLVQ